VQKPYGHGRLRFTSVDPHAQPVITADLLADPRDRARLVEAVLLAKEVAGTEAVQRVSYGVIWPKTGGSRRFGRGTCCGARAGGRLRRVPA
jgi:hypothetical protein